MEPSSRPKRIFHVAPKADWHRAKPSGIYRPASLADEGFLHCSLAHQVLPVANSVFRGQKGLVLLELDEAKIKAEVRHEDLRRSGSPYPHIYGPLNVEAVIGVHAFEPKADGTFAWPKGVVPPEPPPKKTKDAPRA